MIGAIAGDIIGSRFEGRRFSPRGFNLFYPRCRFTDDTVCLLAIADALLGNRDFEVSLRTFVRRHPGRGYGGMFRRWALSDDAPAYNSWGNGAPMRVAPVGWLANDENEALELAEAQAAVSHNHPDAIKAAQAVALAILLLRKGVQPSAVRQRISDDFGYDLTAEWALACRGFDISAAGTVPPALTAAFESDSWEEAVRTVVALGGDTDTLACITGAVAEVTHGVPEEISTRAREYLTDDLLSTLGRFEKAAACTR